MPAHPDATRFPLTVIVTSLSKSNFISAYLSEFSGSAIFQAQLKSVSLWPRIVWALKVEKQVGQCFASVVIGKVKNSKQSKASFFIGFP